MMSSAAPGTAPPQFVPQVERLMGYRQMAQKFGDCTPHTELQLTTMLLLVELIDSVRLMHDDLRAAARNAPMSDR